MAHPLAEPAVEDAHRAGRHRVLHRPAGFRNRPSRTPKHTRRTHPRPTRPRPTRPRPARTRTHESPRTGGSLMDTLALPEDPSPADARPDEPEDASPTPTPPCGRSDSHPRDGWGVGCDPPAHRGTRGRGAGSSPGGSSRTGHDDAGRPAARDRALRVPLCARPGRRALRRRVGRCSRRWRASPSSSSGSASAPPPAQSQAPAQSSAPAPAPHPAPAAAPTTSTRGS